jgi:hypothetical protein
LVLALFEAAKGTSSGLYFGTLTCALAASTVKVRLPGLTSNISLNFLFVLVSIAKFGFGETVLLAAGAATVQSLWGKKRVQVVQVAFNLAVLAAASGVAYRLSHFAALSPVVHGTIFMILVAGLYFVTNTLLVSGVLSLVQGKSLYGIWRQCYLWSFPYYVAGAVVAGLMLETARSAGWLPALVVLTPMAFSYAFYRLCAERAQRGPATA